MTLKLIGSMLIILGCGGFGFYVASVQKAEERTLKQLVGALDYISCELQYRMTPLPQLCRQAALECSGLLNRLFSALADDLEMQVASKVDVSMQTVLANSRDIPQNTLEILQKLGRSLGRFDLDGQLQDLESIRTQCRSRLSQLSDNKDIRLRSYKTLGLCAGAALVILFI